MSEQAETLEELWDLLPAVTDEDLSDATTIEPVVVRAQRFFDAYGQYRLIPGADAVITEEGVECVAAVLAYADAFLFVRMTQTEKDRYRIIARRALKAAGIACAGLTLTANANCGTIIVSGSTGKLGRTPLLPGDRVFIVRAGTSKDGPETDKGGGDVGI